jgi:hypothetical protein
MVIIDEKALQWRRTPVMDVFPGNVGDNLWRAGYKTLAAVLAASEEDLARDVLNVGPVRAKKIRQKALAAAKPAPELIFEPIPPAREQSRSSGPLLALTALVCLGAALALYIS